MMYMPYTTVAAILLYSWTFLLTLQHWCCWDKSVHARAGKCHVVGTIASAVRLWPRFERPLILGPFKLWTKKWKWEKHVLSVFPYLFLTSSSRATRDISLPTTLSSLYFILSQFLSLFSFRFFLFGLNIFFYEIDFR